MVTALKGWFRRKPARVEPDWRSITSYVLLSRAADQADWLTPDQYLAGPFRRFLEICSDADVGARARARAMETGRAAFNRYRNRQIERGVDGAELEARARAMAAEWFGRPEVPNGDYMLEVFDGISNHNWRGTRED